MSNEPQQTKYETECLKKSLKSPLFKREDNSIRVAIGIGGASLDELELFASVGKIEKGDGTTMEKVPLVRFLPEDEMIENELKCVIECALISSIEHGRLVLGDEEYLPTICEYDDCDNWLDY